MTGKALAVLLASFLAAFAATAGARDPAIGKAYDEAMRGNHQAAFAVLRPLAEQGDAEAQFVLAIIQLRPQWQERDPVEGRLWLHRAAEQGHARAQLELGRYYVREERNYGEAYAWYRRVVEQNPRDEAARTAAEHLGALHELGRGVPRDLAEAARWYRWSAERGGLEAQYTVGYFYLEGFAGAKDFDEAVKWLGMAARRHHQKSQRMLVLIYAEGFDTPPNVLEAAYWQTGRRIHDEAEAAYHVGNFYARGFLVYQDDVSLVAWWLKRQGVPDEKSRPYLDAVRGKLWGDESEAVRWYRIAAEKGFVGAQVNLARIHWDPEGRHWNCAEAVKWTRAAADRADPTALLNMGIAYFQGPRERVINGIGVQLENKGEDGVRVLSVVRGGPAEAAGVRPDDHIVEIDGQDARKLGVQGVVDTLRGAKNREVPLRLRRGAGETLAIGVSPREIRFPCPGADAAGLRRDPAEAVKWFEKAAERGSAGGLFYLAQAYRNGTGVVQNTAKALELYRQGADQGDWEAAQAVSHMYATGEAGEVNRELSERWYRKALELKHRSLGRR